MVQQRKVCHQTTVFDFYSYSILYREEQGKFPEYPSDEEGGSALIFNPESVHALDSDGEGNKKEEKGKKEEKKEGEEEEEKGFRLGPSDFLSSLKDGERQFTGNVQQTFFLYFILFITF